MDKWWLGLVYDRPGKKHNVLLYPFLFATFVLGLAYTAFTWTEAVKDSVLYQLTEGLMDFSGSAWGVLALITTLLNILGMVYRKRWLGHTSTFLGIAIWLFAFFMFLLTAHWLQALYIALPNLYFWGWWNRYVTNYHLENDA